LLGQVSNFPGKIGLEGDFSQDVAIRLTFSEA